MHANSRNLSLNHTVPFGFGGGEPKLGTVDGGIKVDRGSSLMGIKVDL